MCLFKIGHCHRHPCVREIEDVYTGRPGKTRAHMTSDLKDPMNG